MNEKARTSISINMLRDPRLSLRAKGLLAMILTQPDDFVLTKSCLINQGPERREALTSVLNELREAGYAKYDVQSKEEDGRFSEANLFFFEDSNDNKTEID